MKRTLASFLMLFIVVNSTHAQQGKGGWLDFKLGYTKHDYSGSIGLTGFFSKNLNYTVMYVGAGGFSGEKVNTLNFAVGYFVSKSIFFANAKAGLGASYSKNYGPLNNTTLYSYNFPVEVESGLWLGPLQLKVAGQYHANPIYSYPAFLFGIGIGAKPPK